MSIFRKKRRKKIDLPFFEQKFEERQKLNVSKIKPVARRGNPLLLLLFFQNKSCMHTEVGTCTEILPWFLSHAFLYSPLSSTLRFRPVLMRLPPCPDPPLVDTILNL